MRKPTKIRGAVLVSEVPETVLLRSDMLCGLREFYCQAIYVVIAAKNEATNLDSLSGRSGRT